MRRLKFMNIDNGANPVMRLPTEDSPMVTFSAQYKPDFIGSADAVLVVAAKPDVKYKLTITGVLDNDGTTTGLYNRERLGTAVINLDSDYVCGVRLEVTAAVISGDSEIFFKVGTVV